jgi:hypothetical protein
MLQPFDQTSMRSRLNAWHHLGCRLANSATTLPQCTSAFEVHGNFPPKMRATVIVFVRMDSDGGKPQPCCWIARDFAGFFSRVVRV